MPFDIPHDQLSRLKQLEDNNKDLQQKDKTDAPFIKVFQVVDGEDQKTKVTPRA